MSECVAHGCVQGKSLPRTELGIRMTFFSDLGHNHLLCVSPFTAPLFYSKKISLYLEIKKYF